MAHSRTEVRLEVKIGFGGNFGVKQSLRNTILIEQITKTNLCSETKAKFCKVFTRWDLMKNKLSGWVKRAQTFLAACVGNFTLFTTGTCSIDLFSFLYHMVLYKLPPYIWRYGIVNENHRRITVNSLTAFKNKYTLATYIAYKLTLYHDLSESININKAFIYNQTIKIKTGKMRNKEGCCQPASKAS